LSVPSVPEVPPVNNAVFWLGSDRLVAAGTLGTVLALVPFGLAHDTPTALVASLLAGAAWIVVLSSLSVSAQLALPEWVRARGLAIFMTVYFGAHTAGSALWGQVAAVWGLPLAHFIAAAGALLAISITWRWHLQTGGNVDLTRSLHWAARVFSHEIEDDRGPVLVTIEYRIDPAKRRAFLAALNRLGHERRRDGAYRWGVFEDAAYKARFVEMFWSIVGSIICVSTSGSPMRTGCCKRRYSVFNWRVRRRSRT
jgi:hypothetical protein